MTETSSEKSARSGDGGGREVELKLRVADLSALMRIATASGGTPQPTVLQTNAFFDTPDRALGTRGLVVRVREERAPSGTIWYVTAKGPGSRNGSITDVAEEEVRIEAPQAKEMLAGRSDPITALEGGDAARDAVVRALRQTLDGRRAVLLGKFQNERTRIPVELAIDDTRFHAVLELDRTSFPGDQVHHEVEMEVPSHVNPQVALRAFQELFTRAGVHGRVSPGKARRFFAALRGERVD